MKSGQIFWGFFLLTLGTLILLTNYSALYFSFDFVWDVWPLIFIFWGAHIIFRNSIVRVIVNTLFGIFLALLVFGFFFNTFISCGWNSDANEKFTHYYSEDYNKNVQFANLEINTGAGTLKIEKTTDKLIEGRTSGSLAQYDFDVNQTDNTVYAQFDFHQKNFKLFKDKLRNNLEISLNPNPVWNIEFNLGASKGKFDLSDYKIRNVRLRTGASSTKIKLGDKLDSTDVDVEMGTASFTLEIPQSSGCIIEGDMVLMSKKFEDFVKRGKGHYETEGFENAKNKIFVRIDGGVSSIKVKRY